MPENSATSQPLKRSNLCQAVEAEVSACPADVQNQFPVAALFSHSNLVVREISSNKILQVFLLSKSAHGQHVLFSAAPCTCMSKGPRTVPQGWARGDGQALSITQGDVLPAMMVQPKDFTLLRQSHRWKLGVSYPSCRRLPGVAPKSHVPSVHLISLAAKREIFFLHLHCWRVCRAGLCPPVCTGLIQWSHNPRCCRHKNRNGEQCLP